MPDRTERRMQCHESYEHCITDSDYGSYITMNDERNENMRYQLLQAYKGHTQMLEGHCPRWIRWAVSDGNADAFLLKKNEEDSEEFTGYMAVTSQDEEPELLSVSASDDKSFKVLFRRLRQYLKEHDFSSIRCNEMILKEQEEEWQSLLLGQHFIVEESESFYRISLDDIEKCAVFAENDKVTNAVEKGRIRTALGATGAERTALLDLMERTHPDRKEEGEYGRAFPELSGIYVHHQKVLAYLFLSVYKGCIIVEECGAEKGMEALLLALMNQFIPEIRNEFPDADHFYIPEKGDLMQYTACKKLLFRKELKVCEASLCHAYWDQDQAFAMREVQELLLPEDEEQEIPEKTVIELMRLQQLEETLDTMQQECMLVSYKDEPALQLWIAPDEGELVVYLRYQLLDVDTGSFVLEATVPMEVLSGEDSEGLSMCMDYNRKSSLSTAYSEEGRLYLRLTHMELELPPEEDAVRTFLEQIVEEWDYFHIMNLDD